MESDIWSVTKNIKFYLLTILNKNLFYDDQKYIYILLEGLNRHISYVSNIIICKLRGYNLENDKALYTKRIRIACFSFYRIHLDQTHFQNEKPCLFLETFQYEIFRDSSRFDLFWIFNWLCTYLTNTGHLSNKYNNTINFYAALT